MSRQGNSGAVRLVAEIAAILSIGAGVVHISAAGDHTEVTILFAGFIVVAVLQLSLGALLLRRRPSKPLVAAGLALMVGSISVWLVSRTVGLPFPEDGHQEPVGFKDGVTVLFELGSIPALLLLLNRELERVSLPSTRLASQTFRAASAACCVLLVPALMLGGGEHHSHEEAVALGLHDESEGHAESEGHEVARTGSKPSHEDAPHRATAGGGSGHGHARRSDDGDDDGHTTHTLAAASPPSAHEHSGRGARPDGGDHRNHSGDSGRRKRGGRDHEGHKKGGERPDEHRGGGHDGHGEGDGGQADEPPGDDALLGVCVSGVCLP